MLGIDLIIPNFDYLREKPREACRRGFNTWHEDHIGALPYFLREFQVSSIWYGFDTGPCGKQDAGDQCKEV